MGALSSPCMWFTSTSLCAAPERSRSTHSISLGIWLLAAGARASFTSLTYAMRLYLFISLVHQQTPPIHWPEAGHITVSWRNERQGI
jgi:hypothetical protein